MLLDDLFGDGVIGLQFQPSLSLLDALQAAFRATSAFFLQAFAQSCVVVGLMSYSFPRVKTGLACCGGGHGQIADAHIDPDDLVQLLAVGSGTSISRGKRVDRRFSGFIVPELGITDAGSLPNECEVLIVALVGDD